MALDDCKLLQEDFTEKGVASLPDAPSEAGMSAQALKQAFDRLVTEVVAQKHNALIDEISASGAQAIGTPALSPDSGETVQAQLSYLFAQLQEISQGGVADGAVTDEKLAQNGILSRFSQHEEAVALHVQQLGLTAGTAAQYTCEGAVEQQGLYVVQVHAACAASPQLVAGQTYTLVPCGTASLEAGQLVQNGAYALYYPGGGTYLYVLNPETHSHTHTPQEAGAAPSAHTHTPQELGCAASGHTHTALASLSISGAVPVKTARVVNVYLSSSATPPAASGVPEGTLFIQYE